MVNPMGTQAALGLLRALREDPALREQVSDRRNELSAEDLVSLGASLGWHFEAQDLSQAFRQDWLLRWLHFSVKNGSKA